MKYTLTHYENNITAITFPFKYNSRTVTYYIDTEDHHYFVSSKYQWKQNPLESVSLHYFDETNKQILFRRLITAAVPVVEQTCVLNYNKFDLRKKNIIKYPSGSTNKRDHIREIQKDELVPYEIDVTKLKVISLDFNEVAKERKTKLKKPKKNLKVKKKDKKKDKKKKKNRKD